MKKNTPAAVYLLAGGPGSNTAKESRLLKKIFSEIPITAPSVAYIGCASGDDKTFFDWISRKLQKSGAGEVKLARTTGKKFQREETLRTLESSDILFFSGGDVEEGIKVLTETGLNKTIQNHYLNGKVFMGVSAGSIMLCKQWIRWIDPEDDSTAEIFPCLGITEILCDTHAEEDNWIELKTLLNLCGETTKGFGIPSGGALVILPDGTYLSYEPAAIQIIKTKKGFEEKRLSPSLS